MRQLAPSWAFPPLAALESVLQPFASRLAMLALMMLRKKTVERMAPSPVVDQRDVGGKIRKRAGVPGELTSGLRRSQSKGQAESATLANLAANPCGIR